MLVIRRYTYTILFFMDGISASDSDRMYERIIWAVTVNLTQPFTHFPMIPKLK